MTANISPKDFYSLVHGDPPRAYNKLSSLPRYSRDPYVSFRNQEGDERSRGQTPLHVAAGADRAELVQLLLDSNSDRDARKANGATPICVASFSGHEKVVARLLAAGADKDAAANNGATPVFGASQNGHGKVVEMLLAAGVEKNTPANDGATPIYMASQNGHQHVVELLLAAGADHNATKNDGATPIYIASQNGHHHVVELLLAAGADKNAAKRDGATPIYIASQNAHYNVVELLLAAGAHKTAPKKDCWTPLAIAQHKSHARVLGLLSSPLPTSAVERFQSRQAELVSRLADIQLALRRFNHEAPFRTILDKFEISSSSRNLLFLTHGLELSTLKHLTIDHLKDALKDNIPKLPTLRLAACFEDLQKVSLPPAPQPPFPATSLDFPHLDNLLIPLDNLKIERTSISEGADGRVYKAEYLGSPVAVKMLTNPDASFRRELEQWCHFRHPNILLLIGFSQPSHSLPWIVMELMDNSLYDLLKNHKIDLSWESRLKMAHGIAAGLVYLHEIRQIIHRDIKSLNILVKGRDYEVKIADFGASRGNTSLISNKNAGTPRWVAPELYDNHPPTLAVDIYAFGITLNELSTRKAPFLELGNNEAAITKAVISRQRPKMDPFPTAGPIPAWHHLFVGLIQTCWHHDPLQRPASSVVFQALAQMLKQPIPISSSSTSTSLPASLSAVQPRTSIHYGSDLEFSFGETSASSDATPVASPSASSHPPAMPYNAYRSDAATLGGPPSPSDAIPPLASPSSSSLPPPMPYVAYASNSATLTLPTSSS